MMITRTLSISYIEEQILKRFSNLIEKEVPEAVKIILFGSRARGESDENSDLDVAVILNVTSIQKMMWNRVWDIKWRVLTSFNAEEFPLSLTLITMNDLISRDFGLEKVIKKEGIVVWERQN